MRVGIDPVHAGEDEQRFRPDQAGDERSRLVVVDALVDFEQGAGERRDLHAPVFRFGHGVVVVDDGNGVLLDTAQKQLADVLALDFVVEMVMLDEDLAHGVLAVHKLAVRLHEDGLPLRGVIRLGVLVVGQFFPRAHHVIQPADLGGAAGDPDIAGFEFAREARDAGIIDHVVLLVDERHRTDLPHEFHVKFHKNPFSAARFAQKSAYCVQKCRNHFYYTL